MRVARRAGFTLLELAVSMLGLGSIGYVLSYALKASADSQREITQHAAENRIVRNASRALLDELAAAGDATVAFATNVGGGVAVEPTLRFQVRIEVDGAATFGATHLGVARENWTIEYAVEAPESASDTRRLVRRVVDADGVVQKSELLVRGVRAPTMDPPGFFVQKTGDVWEITLSTEGGGGHRGVEEVFHVRARN